MLLKSELGHFKFTDLIDIFDFNSHVILLYVYYLFTMFFFYLCCLVHFLFLIFFIFKKCFFRGNLYKNKILNLFYWNTVDLQCYINFCCTEKWFRFIYVQICIYSNIHTHTHTSFHFSSVQSLSCVHLFVIPWIAACQASLSITNSRSSLRLTSNESVMPSSHLILCRPLLLLPPIPPSIRVFSNESTLCMRWPKY